MACRTRPHMPWLSAQPCNSPGTLDGCSPPRSLRAGIAAHSISSPAPSAGGSSTVSPRRRCARRGRRGFGEWLSAAAKAGRRSRRAQSAHPRGHRHPVAEVGGPHALGKVCGAGRANESPPKRSRVTLDPAEVVGDRERLWGRADLQHLKALPPEQRRDRAPGEVLDVGGDHRPPSPAEHPGDAAAGVGKRQPQHSVRNHHLADPLQRARRLRQMLDHVAHRDRIERPLRQRDREQVSPQHLQPEPFARIGGSELAGFDAERLPAALARLRQEEADPASQVKELPSTGEVTFDLLERQARGGALPGLLLNVVRRSRFGIGMLQHVLVRHRVQLHVTAAPAPRDVTKSCAESIGAWYQSLRTELAANREMRLECRRAAGREGSRRDERQLTADFQHDLPEGAPPIDQVERVGRLLEWKARADDRPHESLLDHLGDLLPDLGRDLGLRHHIRSPARADDLGVAEQQAVDPHLRNRAPVKPTTTTRPPSRSERMLSVKRSPPTGSTTTSTPPPETSFAWSFQGPSERTTSSAPASRATRSFSSPETTPIVRAPRPFATCRVAVPTPPAAPWTSTQSPSASRPRSFSAKYAVW